MGTGAPRIRPGSRREIGLVNHAIARLLGAAAGGGPPNLLTTLARRRGLFRRWLLFAGALMPGGKLARADGELLILRVAHNCDCEYEWRHHERIALHSGLSTAEVDRVRLGPGAEGWSERQAALLDAADDLHGDRRISDETWGRLRAFLNDEQLIELCLLVGHYEMLAGALNSLGVQPDELGARPTRAMRVLEAIANRRAAPSR